jgi:AcrR family transcriptional regulator
VPRAKPTDAILAASHASVARFLERGTTAVTVAELASAAGISERTFYRYFPRKEESVRPLLHEATALLVRTFADRPRTESLTASLVAGFDATAAGPYRERTERLVPLLASSEVLRAVWGQCLRDGVRALSGALATRLGEEPTSRRVVVLATVVTGLAEEALQCMAETGDDPVAVFAESLALIARDDFTAPKP